MRIFSKFPSAARRQIIKLLGKENVLTGEVALRLNSYDGAPVRSMPDAVLNIKNAAQLSAVIKILYKYRVPFVPRTAGTNHDGGAIALKGGCVLNLSALNKITLIDTARGCAVVEGGVINQTLQDALAPLGFFYAPDPASMAVSTIGGNAALNAGGAKTLKYGSTAANILKAQIITPQGEVLTLSKDSPGPGSMSLLTRSEGTLSIIDRLWVKITPLQSDVKTICAYFTCLRQTMQAVADIIAAGILPSALEGMDKTTMAATQTPCPAGSEAMLVIELDGKKQQTEKEAALVFNICLNNGGVNIVTASKEEERQNLWAKRKAAASSLVKLAPNLLSLDGALPRAQLPLAIERVRAIFEKYKIRAGLVFHAGDGNIHPNIVFDENNFYETAQIKKAVKEINAAVLAAGGSISGEHGIGVEKRAAMALMFDKNALTLFKNIKAAIDPLNLANPDKVLPVFNAADLKPAKQPPECLKDIRARLKEGGPFTIAGLNTKLKAAKKDILDIKKLNQILDIDKTNYTLTAQAAASVKDIAAELKKHHMYLPIPPVKGSIGGAFAAKTFLDLADYVTGIDFILPGGAFVSLGGKFVKNAAGYDLIRFLAGSQGAYALITALTIRAFAFEPHKQKERAFKLFTPDETDKKLKKVFDPHNILNPFIFKEI
ncbi:MAG: FAD-binding protein [Elusimicrobiota bacterium]|jgi:glycolate oxidase subunit GlcD|nr:FAD-binding protein [Elusimicrobiota bacterium]